MSDILSLRPYQRACLEAIDAALTEGTRRPAVVAATGSGKTHVFAHLTRSWHERGGGRVLILVHRDELVRQSVNKLRSVAPGMNVGVVQGKNNDVDADVIVASVQTLSRAHRLEQLPAIGLVICDECHHSVSASWQRVLEHVGCFDDDVPAVGFTATMSRSDSLQLSDIWERVIFKLDILDMIEGGYLCDVKGRRITVDGLTLDEVVTRGGDYAPSSLSEALMRSNAIDATVKAYLEHADGMSTVVFTPTVAAAHAFTDAFRAADISASTVHGSMPKDERRSVLEAFDAGQVAVIVNVMVLTEGWDCPRAQCVIMARPTLSAGLYVQAVGRVLRPYPGKDSALVLDVSGASEMHRLATLADLTSRRLSDEVLEQAEGASLTEIVRREVERGNPALRDYAVDSYEVDLFAAGGALWLRTYKGVWFISTKDDLYFLWPGSEPGTYSAGKRPITRAGGSFVVKDVDFETAMSWAEQAAREDDEVSGGATLTMKNASWRKGRQRASDGQIGFAQRLGLTVSNAMLKRDVADMITVHMASNALDRNL